MHAQTTAERSKRPFGELNVRRKLERGTGKLNLLTKKIDNAGGGGRMGFKQLMAFQKGESSPWSSWAGVGERARKKRLPSARLGGWLSRTIKSGENFPDLYYPRKYGREGRKVTRMKLLRVKMNYKQLAANENRGGHYSTAAPRHWSVEPGGRLGGFGSKSGAGGNCDDGSSTKEKKTTWIRRSKRERAGAMETHIQPKNAKPLKLTRKEAGLEHH